MNDSTKNQDQSMEDILQSIKRIIAEEDEAPQGSDVLELTELMEEEAAPPVIATTPADEDLSALTMDEIMDAKRKEAEAALAAANAPKPKVAVEPETSVAPAYVPQEAHHHEAEEEEALVSHETFDAAASAFEKLKNLPDALPHVPRFDSMGTRSGTTVEDLLLEALRPMLKDWLDSHLADIVERLVEREVRKISAR